MSINVKVGNRRQHKIVKKCKVKWKCKNEQLKTYQNEKVYY